MRRPHVRDSLVMRKFDCLCRAPGRGGFKRGTERCPRERADGPFPNRIQTA